jgi:hypothetical protein
LVRAPRKRMCARYDRTQAPPGVPSGRGFVYVMLIWNAVP